MACGGRAVYRARGDDQIGVPLLGLAWLDNAHRRRAERALARQRAYQEAKAAELWGREREMIAWMQQRSAQVRSLLASYCPIESSARVLEVGSGAHGLIFFFGPMRSFGVDPLAADYAVLFPAWQRLAVTVAAAGEALPFADGTFDVVLCDNVVDHALNPRRIAGEMSRIMAPGAILYFAVNVHHPVYSIASAAHGAWTAAGIPYELGPFADHTVHLTVNRARELFSRLPLRRLRETVDMGPARAAARGKPRHAGDRLKRLFFKNARYELIASKAAND